jgi:hypothetical protein
VGEQVVVFLYPLSYIGMPSSVGRDQGKFWIQQADSLGAEVVLNKLENKGLFRKLNHPDLLEDQHWVNRKQGPLPYKLFLQTLKSLAAALKEKPHRRK